MQVEDMFNKTLTNEEADLANLVASESYGAQDEEE